LRRHAPAERRAPGPRAILASLATAALAYSFMQTLVLPALPFLAEEFDASPTAAAWIVSAFFLSSSICIPIFGRLGDALGKVRVLIAVMAVLAISTLAAAFAPNLEALIACRVLQGVSGAVFPLSFGIVRDQLPADRVGFGIGVVSAIFGIGSGFGYVMSGVVLELLDWHWLFLVGLVPAILAVALLPRLPESGGRAPARPDWAGGLLLSAGLLALLVGTTQGKVWGWGSPEILGLFAVGILLLGLWTRVERLVADPMVDMEMLKRPAVALLNFSTFLIGYAMMAVYTILPAFVAADPAREEHGFSASPLESGLFLLPVAIAMLVGGPPAGGARRIAPINVLRLGIAAMTIALALIAFAHTERWMLYVWLGLLGLGTGACLAVLGRLAVESVRPDQSGIAGGINTLMRTVGGAVAAQASAVIVSAFALDDGTLVSRGYTYAFAFAALGGSAALVSTLALARARVGLSARFVHYQPTNRLP
jgi:MFS family permease